LEQILVKARERIPMQQPLWVVFDNENKQQHSNWEEICSSYNASRLEHPTYSPDINKPVEHGHAIIATKFAAHCYKHLDVDSPNKYQKLVADIAHTAITQEGVAADVHSMWDMYKVIASPVNVEVVDGVHGTAGGWPPKKMR